MNEIQILLQQYKWVVEKLEFINKNYNELQEFSKIKEELENTKKELEKQKNINTNLLNDNQLLISLLRQFNKIEICKECNWVWCFDIWYGEGWPCDTCKWTWVHEKSKIEF